MAVVTIDDGREQDDRYCRYSDLLRMWCACDHCLTPQMRRRAAWILNAKPDAEPETVYTGRCARCWAPFEVADDYGIDGDGNYVCEGCS